MVDVQDLNSVCLDPIDDDIGKTCNDKLPRSIFTPNAATLG